MRHMNEQEAYSAAIRDFPALEGRRSPREAIELAITLRSMEPEERDRAIAALDTAYVVDSTDARERLIAAVQVRVPRDVASLAEQLMPTHAKTVWQHLAKARKRIDKLEESLKERT